MQSVENQQMARAWAKQNIYSIKETINGDLEKWVHKEDKPILLAADGQDALYILKTKKVAAWPAATVSTPTGHYGFHRTRIVALRATARPQSGTERRMKYVLAGLIFGAVFAALLGISGNLEFAFVVGIASGVSYAVLIFLFVNSKLIRSQTAFPDQDLIDGEEVVGSWPANLLIKWSDLKRGEFAFDKLFWVPGIKGRESIGGRLHLTNYRLLFASHGLNRLRGCFSIFLTSIEGAQDVTRFLVLRKVIIVTRLGPVEFVIEDPKTFCALLLRMAKHAAPIRKRIDQIANVDPGKHVNGL